MVCYDLFPLVPRTSLQTVSAVVHIIIRAHIISYTHTHLARANVCACKYCIRVWDVVIGLLSAIILPAERSAVAAVVTGHVQRAAGRVYSENKTSRGKKKKEKIMIIIIKKPQCSVSFTMAIVLFLAVDTVSDVPGPVSVARGVGRK